MAITLAAVGIITVVAARNRTQQPSFKFSYLRKHGQKAKKLQDLMEELSVRANDIKRRSDIKQKGKEPNGAITVWLQDVENTQNESYRLMAEVSERKKYINGRLLLPNFHSRLKLGKHMEAMIMEVIELLGDARFLDDPQQK